MIQSISKKEFISVVRDKQFLIVTLLTFFLVLISLVSSYQSMKLSQNIQFKAQAHADEEFKNQPDRHPHRVAYYGTFVFKTISPLSFFDPGLNSFTGNSIFLEAHKQNSVNFGIAEQATSLIRFGEFNPAMVFLILLPLIIVFLVHSSFPKESELGTLKILIVQGASIKNIMWEK